VRTERLQAGRVYVLVFFVAMIAVLNWAWGFAAAVALLWPAHRGSPRRNAARRRRRGDSHRRRIPGAVVLSPGLPAHSSSPCRDRRAPDMEGVVSGRARA